MRNILILLSLLVVLTSGCDMFGKKKREEQARIEAQRKTDSIAKVKKQKAIALKKAEEQKKKEEEAKRKAEEERRRLYKFHIIVGSFKTPQYAAEYNNKMSGKGYQTEILTNRDNFQMVSIGAYKSWSDAVKELVKAQEALEASAWIYIRE